MVASQSRKKPDAVLSEAGGSLFGPWVRNRAVMPAAWDKRTAAGQIPRRCAPRNDSVAGVSVFIH